MIDGVIITKRKQIIDERGKIMHMLRNDEKIFKNFSPMQNEIEVESIFVSYPGTISTTRYLRGFVEYTQFFYFYVVISLLGGMYFLPRHRQTLVFIIMIYTAFFVGFADKSCVSF